MADKSGPSDKAVEVAIAASHAAHSSQRRPVAILEAVHDPALGLDRSVCLRDVVEALRSRAKAEHGGLSPYNSHAVAADFIEHKFGLASLEQKED